MQIWLYLTVVMVLLTTATACTAKSEAPDTAPSLEQASWTLKKLFENNVHPETQVTMQFDEGHISGSDGCNRYRAPVMVNGRDFILTGPALSTRRACPREIMDQAMTFMSALNETRTFIIQDNHLMLQNADHETVAVFALQK